jgi:hypothetical protein
MKNAAHVAAAIWPLLGAVALSGCVSVFEGTSQEIKVGTNPSDAMCTFEREGQSIGAIVKTPGSLVVRKSKYDITIKCNKAGYQEASYVNHSGTSDTIAVNVVVDLILTAGISSIVDSANGADNWYEPTVNITMIQIGGPTPTSAPAPAAPATPSVTPAAATVTK